MKLLKDELKEFSKEELEYLFKETLEFYNELDKYLSDKIGEERYVKYLEDFTKKKIAKEIKAKVYETVKELTGAEEREDLN